MQTSILKHTLLYMQSQLIGNTGEGGIQFDLTLTAKGEREREGESWWE